MFSSVDDSFASSLMEKRAETSDSASHVVTPGVIMGCVVT